MEFRILGLLEVVESGAVVALRGAKQRALLAMLVLNVNRAVSTEQLLAALWGDDPPPTAANTLHGYISHLRRALGPACIVTRSPGYVLEADPATIDAIRFEELADVGRRVLDAGDPVRALSALGAALALWRGSALADFPYAVFAHAEASRLEERRIVVVEDTLEAELALGHHGAAVGRLQVLVEEHPLRERLWASLMLALYRCGRQAEALRSYQSLRNQLIAELGIEPSPKLQRLEAAILLQRRDLDVTPPDVGGGSRSLPLPDRLVADDLPAVFVGRKEELAVLVDAFNHVVSRNRRRVVLVGGEAGIGKTTMVGEFARTVHDQGAIVVYGRCDEDLGVAYQPWAGAIAHLISHPPSLSVADLAAAREADLAPLGPTVGPATEGGGASKDPETARYLLFGSVLRIFQAAGYERPVVLVLDDLQWASTPSLALLRYLVGSDLPMALLVVGVFRDDDARTNSSLADALAWLYREPGVARVGLTGLSEAEVLRLLEPGDDLRVNEVDLALRDALVSETNGNPFYVGEMLRHLVETEVVCRTDGHWQIRGDMRSRGLPVSVVGVIGRRVARLGAEAAGVLSMAAVLGRDFELDILVAVSERSEEVVLDALDAAAAATLVVNESGDRSSFVHALVQRALYDTVSPARRARAHRRAGEAIEAACGADPGARVVQLAFHYAQAGGSADPAKAIAYARAAGDRALAQLAPDEGLRWYGQALALVDRYSPDHDAQYGALLVGLGEAQRQTGDPAFRSTLLEAGRIAGRLGDGKTLIAAALANTRGFFSEAGKVDHERVRALHEAIGACEPGDSTVHAQLLAYLAAELVFSEDFEARVALCDEAVAMARRIGDVETLVLVLNVTFVALWAPSTMDRRIGIAAEARKLAAGLDDPTPGFYAAVFGANAAMEAGAIDVADDLLASSRLTAEDIGQPVLRWYWLITRAKREMIGGSLDECERLTREALSTGEQGGQADAVVWFEFQIAIVRLLWQDRLSEATDWAQGGDPTASMTGSVPMLVQAATGVIYSELGREAEARRIYEKLMVDDLRGLPNDCGWLGVVVLCAQLCSFLHDKAHAAALLRLLRPYRRQFVDAGPTWLGSTARYLGLVAAVLGRTDEAVDHFCFAAEAHRRIGSPVWAARVHLDWGKALLATEDMVHAGSATEQLEMAREAAIQFRLPRVDQQATTLLGGDG